MTTTFLATLDRPGPDDNAAHPWLGETQFAIREIQAVGRPYRYIEGRAVPYDVFADIGVFLEAHAVDSFKRSTNGPAKNAPLLLFHDSSSFPIGHAESWNHIGDGLHGVWKLNDSAEAQRAGQAAEAGDMIGLSVGFQPVNSQWELVDNFAPELGAAHKDRVTRTQSRLVEVSMTPTPAFVDAMVTEVREAATYTRAARAQFLGPSDADRWRDELDRLSKIRG
jgi:hypothetical protein